MATLEDAIDNIQSKALSLDGIKNAPSKPSEALNQFPSAITYAALGLIQYESGQWAHFFHTIICEMHFSRVVGIGQAVDQAMPYIETFARKLLLDPRLGDTVDTINDVRYTFGELRYGDETAPATIGIRWEIDVKMTLS